MDEMTTEEFRRSKGRVLRRSKKSAQVVHDDEGVVMVIGSEGDANFAAPEDDDEGPVVGEKTVTATVEPATEGSYFASR